MKKGAVRRRQTMEPLTRRFERWWAEKCFVHVFVVESRRLHRKRNPCDRAGSTTQIQQLVVKILFQQFGWVSDEIQREKVPHLIWRRW
jgi:hypothetical protein